MDWLKSLHPDYWFFRQTRNEFERYWGEGQGWNGFFSAWFSGATAIFMFFLMALGSTPSFEFAWQPLLAIGVVSLMISFFVIPIMSAIMLIGAIARKEIDGRRESHRRLNEAMLEAARRQRQKKDKE